MHILGDARALAFEGVLALHLLQFALVLARNEGPDHEAAAKQCYTRAPNLEGACLPEKRQDRQRNACAFLIPETVVVRGRHPELIFPRWNSRIDRFAPGSRIHPLRIEPFELV